MFKQKKFRKRASAAASEEENVTDTGNSAKNVQKKRPVLLFDDDDGADGGTDDEATFQIKKTKASKQIKTKMMQAPPPADVGLAADAAVGVEVGFSSGSLYSAEALASLRAKQSYGSAAADAAGDVVPTDMETDATAHNTAKNSLTSTSGAGGGLDGMMLTGEEAEVMEELTDTCAFNQTFLVGASSAAGSAAATRGSSSGDGGGGGFRTEAMDVAVERERQADLLALQQARQRNLADISTTRSTKLSMVADPAKEGDFIALSVGARADKGKGVGSVYTDPYAYPSSGGLGGSVAASGLGAMTGDEGASDRWESEVLLRAGGERLVAAAAAVPRRGATAVTGSGAGPKGGGDRSGTGNENGDGGGSLQQEIARIIRDRDRLAHAHADNGRRVAGLREELGLTATRRVECQAELAELIASDELFQRFRVYCSEVVGMLRVTEPRIGLSSNTGAAATFLSEAARFSTQCRENRLQQQDDILYRLMTSDSQDSSGMLGDYVYLVRERYRASKGGAGGSGGAVSVLGHHLFGIKEGNTAKSSVDTVAVAEETDSFGRVRLVNQSAGLASAVLLSQLRVREGRRLAAVAATDAAQLNTPSVAEDEAVLAADEQCFSGIGMSRGLGFASHTSTGTGIGAGMCAASATNSSSGGSGTKNICTAHVICAASVESCAQFMSILAPVVEVCTEVSEEVDPDYISCAHLCDSFRRFRSDPYWAPRYEGAYVAESLKQMYFPLALFALMQDALLDAVDAESSTDAPMAWLAVFAEYCGVGPNSAAVSMSDAVAFNGLAKQALVDWLLPLLVAALQSQAFLDDTGSSTVGGGQALHRIYRPFYVPRLYAMAADVVAMMACCNDKLAFSRRLAVEPVLSDMAARITETYATALGDICLPILSSLDAVSLSTSGASDHLLCPVRFYMQQVGRVAAMAEHLTAVVFAQSSVNAQRAASLFTADDIMRLTRMLFDWLLRHKASTSAVLRLVCDSITSADTAAAVSTPVGPPPPKKVKMMGGFVMSSSSYSSVSSAVASSAPRDSGVNPSVSLLRECQVCVISMLLSVCRTIIQGAELSETQLPPSSAKTNSKAVRFSGVKEGAVSAAAIDQLVQSDVTTVSPERQRQLTALTACLGANLTDVEGGALSVQKVEHILALVNALV